MGDNDLPGPGGCDQEAAPEGSPANTRTGSTSDDEADESAVWEPRRSARLAGRVARGLPLIPSANYGPSASDSEPLQPYEFPPARKRSISEGEGVAAVKKPRTSVSGNRGRGRGNASAPAPQPGRRPGASSSDNVANNGYHSVFDNGDPLVPSNPDPPDP